MPFIASWRGAPDISPDMFVLTTETHHGREELTRHGSQPITEMCSASRTMPQGRRLDRQLNVTRWRGLIGQSRSMQRRRKAFLQHARTHARTHTHTHTLTQATMEGHRRNDRLNVFCPAERLVFHRLRVSLTVLYNTGSKLPDFSSNKIIMLLSLQWINSSIRSTHLKQKLRTTSTVSCYCNIQVGSTLNIWGYRQLNK